HEQRRAGAGGAAAGPVRPAGPDLPAAAPQASRGRPRRRGECVTGSPALSPTQGPGGPPPGGRLGFLHGGGVVWRNPPPRPPPLRGEGVSSEQGVPFKTFPVRHGGCCKSPRTYPGTTSGKEATMLTPRSPRSFRQAALAGALGVLGLLAAAGTAAA